MAKEELLEMRGIVKELLPNAMFRVKLENDHEILGHTAGRMRKNRIRVLAGSEHADLDLVSAAALRGARERLLSMALAARRLGIPTATRQVSDCCLELAHA